MPSAQSRRWARGSHLGCPQVHNSLDSPRQMSRYSAAVQEQTHGEPAGRRRAGVTSPVPPDEMRCPCDSTVLRPREGFWARLWWYALLPLITLGIYAVIVLIGAALAQSYAPAGVVVMLLPVLSLLIVLITMLVFRHRGWCLVRRTVAWWFWWPGTLLVILASF